VEFFKADKAFPLSQMQKVCTRISASIICSVNFDHYLLFPACTTLLVVNYWISTANTIATVIQILPEMIERSKGIYHNVKTSSSSYKNLDAFRRASLNNKVKDLTCYTDELRWIKSKSEIKLMRESASIVSQV
jgi:Xaa-Pro aminopeptidase